MPFKKRTFAEEHRVIVRRYLDGPKKPPHQSVEVLEVFDTEDGLTARYNGQRLPLDRIDPTLRGGVAYELNIR